MTSNKPVYVQLEAGDDVAAIRDRLSFIRGKRVLLIWPEEGTTLIRKLDLVLVQREARRRALQIALVTHDEDVIRNANDLGISTYETIGASERGRWSRGRTRVFIQRFHKPKDEPEPEELMDVASRVRLPRKNLSRLQSFLLRLIVLGILFGAVGAAAFAALPYATVTIALTQETVTVETSITANPDVTSVDVENGLIPATVLRATVETTGTIATTGTQQLSDVLATGTITLTNQTEQSITVPAGTIVSTSAGTPILFTITESVVVPAGVGQRADASVEAVQGAGGQAGNVETGLINTVIGPLESQITARNLTPTTGGQNRSIAIVTPDDRERLLAIVRGQLQSVAFTQMEANLDDSQFIIIETIAIVEERNDWTNFSHQIGDATDTITLSMRVVVQAVAIDDRLGQQVTLAQLSAQIPRGRTLRSESISYTRGAVMNIENSRVTFNASGSGVIAGQVNTQWLQERLAGRTLQEAEQIILNEVDIADGAQPIISVWPEGFSQMPIIPIRISVQVQNP